MKEIINMIKKNAPIEERRFIQKELENYMTSEERRLMLTGRKYYGGKQAIDNKRRVAKDYAGNEVEVEGAPNNKITNNLFDDLVDQKTAFLLGNPLLIKTKSEEIKSIFDETFLKKLRSVGKEAYICGIGYIIPYIQDNAIKFKKVRAEQVLVFWSDEDKTEADSFIYFYDMDVYKAEEARTVRFIEYYDRTGVRYYKYNEEGEVVQDTDKEAQPHILINGIGYNFQRVPLVAFRANEEAQPLIVRVKSLQDAHNTMLSNLLDNMQEDMRNTILVVKNYEGTDLSEFRKNLNAYGVIKVTTVDGMGGGVEALRIEVNAENYQLVLRALEEAIIKNGRGVDTKELTANGYKNQTHIQSLYNDIILDSRLMESEFQSALRELMYFIDTFLGAKGVKTQEVKFIFDKDVPVNTTEVIQNCRDSVGIISQETILENHPFVRDTQEELKRLKKEKENEINEFSIPLQGGEVDEQ